MKDVAANDSAYAPAYCRSIQKTGRVVTESSLQVLDQVPAHDGRYVRAADIPQPYRDELVADSRGSTTPLPDGEAGQCFFAHDYKKWLTYRSSPDYAPRFPKTCPAGSRDERPDSVI